MATPSRRARNRPVIRPLLIGREVPEAARLRQAIIKRVPPSKSATLLGMLDEITRRYAELEDTPANRRQLFRDISTVGSEALSKAREAHKARVREEYARAEAEEKGRREEATAREKERQEKATAREKERQEKATAREGERQARLEKLSGVRRGLDELSMRSRAAAEKAEREAKPRRRDMAVRNVKSAFARLQDLVDRRSIPAGVADQERKAIRDLMRGGRFDEAEKRAAQLAESLGRVESAMSKKREAMTALGKRAFQLAESGVMPRKQARELVGALKEASESHDAEKMNEVAAKAGRIIDFRERLATVLKTGKAHADAVRAIVLKGLSRRMAREKGWDRSPLLLKVWDATGELEWLNHEQLMAATHQAEAAGLIKNRDAMEILAAAKTDPAGEGSAAYVERVMSRLRGRLEMLETCGIEIKGDELDALARSAGDAVRGRDIRRLAAVLRDIEKKHPIPEIVRQASRFIHPDLLSRRDLEAIRSRAAIDERAALGQADGLVAAKMMGFEQGHINFFLKNPDVRARFYELVREIAAGEADPNELHEIIKMAKQATRAPRGETAEAG